LIHKGDWYWIGGIRAEHQVVAELEPAARQGVERRLPGDLSGPAATPMTPAAFRQGEICIARAITGAIKTGKTDPPSSRY